MSATCDTSVLVAALLPTHEAHDAARQALVDVDAVPAHVLWETYSVLTRMPPPHRIAAEVASAALSALPFDTLAFSGAVRDVLQECAAGSIAGGAAYDALVAATARTHSRMLLTRDRRAQRTYDALGVAHRFI